MHVKNVPSVSQEFSNRYQECALLELPISLVSNHLPLKCPALRCVLRQVAASITLGELEIFSLIRASYSKRVVQLLHVKPGNLDV